MALGQLDVWAESRVSVLCRKCLGIIHPDHVLTYRMLWTETEASSFRCPCCGTRFELPEDYRLPGEYFAIENLVLRRTPEYKARRAELATKTGDGKFLPFDLILNAIQGARNFIHLVSPDLSGEVENALLAARKNGAKVRRLKLQNMNEQQMEFHYYDSRSGTLVVDGMIAFMGPGAFSRDAWSRQKLKLKDYLVITDELEAARINNLRFSPAWATNPGIEEEPIIINEVPF